MLKHFIAIALSFAASNFVAAQDDGAQRERDYNARLEQIKATNAKLKVECERKGGTFFELGFSLTPECATPSADAGKLCMDNSQCSIRCLAPASALPGVATDGECDKWKFTLGRCVGSVINGISTGSKCQD